MVHHSDITITDAMYSVRFIDYVYANVLLK